MPGEHCVHAVLVPGIVSYVPGMHQTQSPPPIKGQVGTKYSPRGQPPSVKGAVAGGVVAGGVVAAGVVGRGVVVTTRGPARHV